MLTFGSSDPARKIARAEAQPGQHAKVRHHTGHHHRSQAQQTLQHVALIGAGISHITPINTADITSTAITSLVRNSAQPGCGWKIFCLRSCQYSSEAFRQAAKPIDSAGPACFSGPINAVFITCVMISVMMAILTGVLMSCRE